MSCSILTIDVSARFSAVCSVAKNVQRALACPFVGVKWLPFLFSDLGGFLHVSFYWCLIFSGSPFFGDAYPLSFRMSLFWADFLWDIVKLKDMP